ncbi:unnamed protein product [Closterium sp. NIES-64]|nr:unnamed protein product [Closterium sp. NIES-64]
MEAWGRVIRGLQAVDVHLHGMRMALDTGQIKESPLALLHELRPPLVLLARSGGVGGEEEGEEGEEEQEEEDEEDEGNEEDIRGDEEEGVRKKTEMGGGEGRDLEGKGKGRRMRIRPKKREAIQGRQQSGISSPTRAAALARAELVANITRCRVCAATVAWSYFGGTFGGRLSGRFGDGPGGVGGGREVGCMVAGRAGQVWFGRWFGGRGKGGRGGEGGRGGGRWGKKREVEWMMRGGRGEGVGRGQQQEEQEQQEGQEGEVERIDSAADLLGRERGGAEEGQGRGRGGGVGEEAGRRGNGEEGLQGGGSG